MKITNIHVSVIGPQTPRHTWAEDLPEQYMTLTLVRIMTDQGIEGISGVTTYSEFDFDRSLAESLRRVLPFLIGADPLYREQLWRRLRARALPTLPMVSSAIDIALWDLLGQATRLPLYQLLGGARDRIRAYASTVMLDSPQAYLILVEDLIARGFTAIKFHAWANPDRDLQLIRAVGEHFAGSPIDFMFDAENHYDFAGALRVAKELERWGFTWFEAPLSDFDTNGYRELRARVDVPIIGAGNWVLELPSIADALAANAWSAARTDVTVCGGFTAMRKVMALAEAYGKTVEIQSWGYTATQIANLHAMLAWPNCSYFELPVPHDAFEYGMQEVIRIQPDGCVYAPQGAGLGLQIDWQAMQAATVYAYEYT